MTLKRYRICIFICLVIIVVCGLFYLYEKEKSKDKYEDGVLVEREYKPDEGKRGGVPDNQECRNEMSTGEERDSWA